MTFIMLLIVFVGVMGIAVLSNFQKKYEAQTLLTSVYFIATSLAVLFIFPITQTVLSSSVIVWLCGIYLVALISYYLARWFLVAPTDFIERYGDKNMFIKLSYPFLITKAFEILFQQLCFVSFVFLLAAENISLPIITIIFLAALLFLHLPLLATHSVRWGTGYTLAAFSLGLLFPYLILRMPDGLAITYTLHLLGYVAAGIGIWLYRQGKA